jgi:lipopolysaccharide transport system ATP-binding protein
MSTVIQVSNLSKIYRLGEIGTGTISRDLERWYKMRIRGQEDPFLKIGETNERSKKGVSDVVYALRDINFEVQQGEALGIIGKNGAGKSTLLKIISRVTSPTTGKINIKGRVASLLEVGTGFHPELTGRENIYLNGAILGMRKKEITRKLDEIIDFSGVERYIDTPVKRYSSGMYVRLAFAVAAHLESEILIVDEVLAVGDAEFQKKCLGKMSDISKGEGRTVLFVSHNLGAIQNLCNKCILLNIGRIVVEKKTNEVIEKYIEMSTIPSQMAGQRIGNHLVFFADFRLENENGKEVSEFFMNDDLFIKIIIHFEKTITNLEVAMNVKNIYDEIFTHITTLDNGFFISGMAGEEIKFRIKLRNINFTPGIYKIDIGMVRGSDIYDINEGCLSFQLVQGRSILRPGTFPAHVKTFVKSEWEKLA